jgi:hypothetical protein
MPQNARVTANGIVDTTERSGRFRRRGGKGRWLIAGMVATIVGVLMYAVLWPELTRDPFRAAPITDSRACPGSNDDLADATTHFGLAVPSRSTEVGFYSDVNGLFGERTLALRFRTTRAGLEQFTGQPGFPAHDSPDAGNSRMQLWPDACGAAWPQATQQHWRDRAPVDGRLRQVDVDSSDPEHPLVLYSAMDSP